MTRVLRLIGHIDAVTPIQHGGDEKTGSTPVLRSMRHWDPDAGEHVRLPFLSGNAIRGMLRRLLMHDFFERIGYEVRGIKLHHAFFTGGSLESTDESSGQIDLGFRRAIRDAFPPLGLLGTVLGNQMLGSCLRVDHAIPICREYRAYCGSYADDPRTQHGVRTFTDTGFATRRDDLRATREEDEQAVQMMIEFEAFIPGTRFLHGFSLHYASEHEVAALAHLLDLWRAQPVVAGKSGSGYGRVQFHYAPALSAAPYLAYLHSCRTELHATLDDMGARLGDKVPAHA